jgi:protoheme ferro-lyase
MQEAPPSLRQKGYRLHVIPPFNQQPSFIRSLAEVVWDKTDNHPSQSAS